MCHGKTPDNTFLSENVRSILADNNTHAEIDCRHSLQLLEEFFKVYTQFYDDGKVAPPGSAWQKDNQFSYSTTATFIWTESTTREF